MSQNAAVHHQHLTGLHPGRGKVLLITSTNMVMVNIGWASTPEEGVVLHPSSFFATIKCHSECPFVNSR